MWLDFEDTPLFLSWENIAWNELKLQEIDLINKRKVLYLSYKKILTFKY